MTEAKFPHCDPRILHKPSTCEFCDMHPELQQEREEKNISFTGEPPQRGKYPCPAEQARSSANLNAWPGNRAHPHGSEDPHDALVKAIQVLNQERSNPSDSK